MNEGKKKSLLIRMTPNLHLFGSAEFWGDLLMASQSRQRHGRPKTSLSHHSFRHYHCVINNNRSKNKNNNIKPSPPLPLTPLHHQQQQDQEEQQQNQTATTKSLNSTTSTTTTTARATITKGNRYHNFLQLH